MKGASWTPWPFTTTSPRASHLTPFCPINGNETAGCDLGLLVLAASPAARGCQPRHQPLTTTVAIRNAPRPRSLECDDGEIPGASSIGCSTLSMSPFLHAMTGELGGSTAGQLIAANVSDLTDRLAAARRDLGRHGRRGQLAIVLHAGDDHVEQAEAELGGLGLE